MFKIILLVLGLLLVASPAHARQWWTLNYGTGTCEVGTLTPDAADKFYRMQDAEPPVINIRRDEDGNITAVLVQGNNHYMEFASSSLYCERLRKAALADGTLIDHRELR